MTKMAHTQPASDRSDQDQSECRASEQEKCCMPLSPAILQPARADPISA